MVVLIAILLLIVIILGVSSGMQSYATAQQAQATIEVARVAQISSWGNLISILTIILVLVTVVALVALVLWFLYKRSTLNRPRPTRAISPTSDARPQVSVNELTQLMMLDMLRSMKTTSPPTPLLQERGEEEPVDEPFHWLK